MLLLILEIILLMIGVVTLYRRSVPSFLMGRAGYQIVGRTATMIGMVMIAPLPLTLCMTLFLATFQSEIAPDMAVILEAVNLGFAAVLSFILIVVLKEPIKGKADDPDFYEPMSIEEEIEQRTRGAYIYLIIGLFGPVGFVMAPLVFIRTTQAISLIEQHQVGQEFRKRAQLWRTLAMLQFSALSILAVVIVAPLL